MHRQGSTGWHLVGYRSHVTSKWRIEGRAIKLYADKSEKYYFDPIQAQNWWAWVRFWWTPLRSRSRNFRLPRNILRITIYPARARITITLGLVITLTLCFLQINPGCLARTVTTTTARPARLTARVAAGLPAYPTAARGPRTWDRWPGPRATARGRAARPRSRPPPARPAPRGWRPAPRPAARLLSTRGWRKCTWDPVSVTAACILAYLA